MEQHINNFIKYLAEVKQASKNTLQAYQNDLKRLQLYLEKHNINLVSQINETCLNSYVLSMEKDGLAPASVSRNIAAMKAFLLYLIKHGQISGEDPSERIKPPKVPRKVPQIINTTLIDKLLQQPDKYSLKGIRDRAMLELLYATGIKVSELLSLKETDINLTGRYITCGNKRERIIPIGKSAKTALQEYLSIKPVELSKKDNDFLFLNSSGEQLSRQGLWKILNIYAEMAGIKDINPSAIRHAFAAHMLDNGGTIGSVHEFLGHSDIMTTQFYFANNHNNSREVYKNTHPRA